MAKIKATFEFNLPDPEKDAQRKKEEKERAQREKEELDRLKKEE